jgi:hypothetical protein
MRLTRIHHTLKLHLPAGWAERFPQSAYLLSEETAQWVKPGLTWRLQTI